MSFFNQYPYINVNDLNLDFILKAIREMRYEVTNFVSINAIKYADPIQWNITSQYEKNTIVIDPTTGTAYISVAPVPAGIALSRDDYWTVVFDLSVFITQGNKNITERVEPAGTIYSTFALNTGDWVVWNGELYKALDNLPVGTAYSPNYNIKRVTVEEYVKNILNAIDTEVQARIDADGALSGRIDDEVQARQDADGGLSDRIDDEVQARIDADGGLSDRIDDEVQARQDADTALSDKIGNLNDLQTTNKDSAVDAINEIVNGLSGLYDTADIRNYGGTGDGVTNDTNAFNACLAANGAVYLPVANGLKYVLDAVTIPANSTIIGDEGTEILFAGSGSLFTITGSHVAIKNLIVRCSNDGTVFELLNTNAGAWIEYVYISEITTYRAKHVWKDDNSTNSYTNTYLNRISGRAMRGTAFSFEHAFAFLFLDNLTGDNLNSGLTCDWRTFYFKNCEGAHLTHCEAEGGGVDGSHPAAGGFYFDACKAIWLERCMSDLVEGSGFWFNNCEFIYLVSCITSISFGNGFVFNGSKFVVTNCVANGRRSLSPNLASCNGFYSYAADLSLSNCYANEMTGFGLAIVGSVRNNVSDIDISNNGSGIYLNGAASGIVRDIVMMNNDTNTVQDTITGTLKYCDVWNGTTMLTNITP